MDTIQNKRTDPIADVRDEEVFSLGTVKDFSKRQAPETGCGGEESGCGSNDSEGSCAEGRCAEGQCRGAP